MKKLQFCNGEKDVCRIFKNETIFYFSSIKNRAQNQVLLK